MTLDLYPLDFNTPFYSDAIALLIRYGDIIFSENKNPVAVFLDGLESGLTRPIVAVLDGKFIGVVVFYDFQYFAKDKFVCYMYGGGRRGFAKELELSFNAIFQSLKEQGCIAVRCETKKFNLPMRFMARRLGFRKVGEFFAGNYSQGKIHPNIIYEKIL